MLKNSAAVLAVLLYAMPARAADASSVITPDGVLAHIKALASDKFEGRAPGTKGEDLTVEYVGEQFKKLGLKPGNPDGGYTQTVPLVAIRSRPTALFHASTGAAALELKYPDDYVAVSKHVKPEVTVKGSDVLFVGYGVVAPEYGWDDYKGVDVKGKTIVMLINDPAIPDPKDPTKLDEKMFKGKAMTYYGRWTYKYEIATQKGAAAAVIIHETIPAAYPFEVVQNSWGGENSSLKNADGNLGRVPVESWISSSTAVKLLAMGGQDFEALKKAALSRDFKPVPLNVKADFTIKQTIREIKSRNVLGRLEGGDARLKDEHVVYTAHWDHFGKDEKLKGDQIFNGALDNASGVASIIELARAFSQTKPRPKRSLLFLAVTAEEQGLLGSKFYAENPLYPLAKTLAEINIDCLNVWGPTEEIVAVGLGNSTLDDLLVDAARKQGRVVEGDPEPEKGGFFRSDHFEFAKAGVPALNYGEAVRFKGKPAGWGLKKRAEYEERDYHKPSDEIKPDWDLRGGVEDLRLLYDVGLRVADGAAYPTWKPGTEFKAVREASKR